MIFGALGAFGFFGGRDVAVVVVCDCGGGELAFGHGRCGLGGLILRPMGLGRGVVRWIEQDANKRLVRRVST